MKLTKRNTLKAAVAAAAGTALLFGASFAQAQDKGTIGVSMPTKSSARWIADGDNMVKVLKDKGYKADLQYADDDIPNQLAQIENMITKKVKVLVIASIDGTTLSNALQKAADAGIKVIAYDRLIKGSKNVDYYTTFDNFQVGVLQAGTIIDKLGLKQGKGPFNIELFGGSPDDNNAFFFYDGAMSAFKPYLDSGKLVVRSKQVGMDKVGTLRWDGAVAQARMDNLLSAFYGKARVDAVLSPYDGLSIGILSSLKGVGYGKPDQPFPGRLRPGCGSRLGQVDAAPRAVLDDLQGHPRTRQGHGQHDRRAAERQEGRDQRHQDLQQRRQGRALLPAEAGGRDPRELEAPADRQRLLQGRAVQVIAA